MKYRSRLRFALESVEGVAVALTVLLTWPVSKRWLRDWGSHPEERAGVWPGDELVMPGHTTYTRGIDIAAPAGDVWPWVVQFGLGRAGFYSYELLERLVGIPVRNVESIVPELQSLSVGDEILLHPKAPGIPVAALQAGRHVCFGPTEGPARPDHEPDPARSWSIYIEPGSGSSSRLLLRGCVEPRREPTLMKRIAQALEEPVDFTMEQRMLRTIRRLAESAPARKAGPAAAP